MVVNFCYCSCLKVSLGFSLHLRLEILQLHCRNEGQKVHSFRASSIYCRSIHIIMRRFIESMRIKNEKGFCVLLRPTTGSDNQLVNWNLKHRNRRDSVSPSDEGCFHKIHETAIPKQTGNANVYSEYGYKNCTRFLVKLSLQMQIRVLISSVQRGIGCRFITLQTTI